MATTSMTVNMRDTSNNEIVSTTITYLNPDLFPQSGNTKQEVYQAVDNVGRRIAALSENNYVDTIISRTESVTEILS